MYVHQVCASSVGMYVLVIYMRMVHVQQVSASSVVNVLFTTGVFHVLKSTV